MRAIVPATGSGARSLEDLLSCMGAVKTGVARGHARLRVYAGLSAEAQLFQLSSRDSGSVFLISPSSQVASVEGINWSRRHYRWIKPQKIFLGWSGSLGRRRCERTHLKESNILGGKRRYQRIRGNDGLFVSGSRRFDGIVLEVEEPLFVFSHEPPKGGRSFLEPLLRALAMVIF